MAGFNAALRRLDQILQSMIKPHIVQFEEIDSDFYQNLFEQFLLLNGYTATNCQVEYSQIERGPYSMHVIKRDAYVFYDYPLAEKIELSFHPSKNRVLHIFAMRRAEVLKQAECSFVGIEGQDVRGIRRVLETVRMPALVALEEESHAHPHN